jgi:hypothetical protein
VRDRTVSAVTITAGLFATAAAALALLSAPADSDLFWHLASANWMLDHGALLDRDVFSFTRAGVPYQTGQWLGELILGLVFREWSWLGLVVLRAIIVGAATFFACRAIGRMQPHVGWATLPAILVILESRAIWGDRPQLFSLALFPLVFDVLLATRLDGNARRLLVIPPLFLAWANLHGAFTAGLALVVVFVVEALIRRDRTLLRGFGSVGLASVLASFVNPAGFRAIAAGASYASAAGSLVAEEGPLDVLTARGAIFAAFLLASLGAALLLGREGIDRRVGPSALLWTGLIVPFALLGLAIQRQAPFACIVMAPFVASAVPTVLGRVTALPPRVPVLAAGAFAVLAISALALEAALAAPRAPDLARYPQSALAPLSGTAGNLFNEYDWGGYLIYAAPDRPVFIDGRGGILFVPDVLADFQDAVRLRPNYRDVLAKWDIKVALVRPDRPLAVALREEGWRVVAEQSDLWVLLERPR